MHDTLMYVKKLEAAGVSRSQAETQVEIMGDFMNSNFATRQDLAELRQEVKILGIELRHEMAQLESRLVIRLGIMMGTMMTLGITVVGIMIKFL